MIPALPGMKLSAHFDLFKNNEDGSKGPLVQTSRKCEVCHKPLLGAVATDGHRQLHIGCRGRV